jgi:hypothetical protein
MTHMYFDRTGKPLTLWEWAALMEANLDRHVADDMVGQVRVSTVWLGLNHNWGLGPPLIFETMVFGGTMDEDQWRYPTEAAALAGHDQVVTMVRQAEEELAQGFDRAMSNIKYYLDAQK